MISGLQIHRYELRSKSAPNAATSRRIFPGALLRTAEGGHGCIHPWPELGDHPLEAQLASLVAADDGPLPLAARALDCAQIDAEARALGRSLFAGVAIPDSHYLWRADLADVDQAAEVAEKAYPAVKIKLGPNPQESLSRVRTVAELVAAPLRLDFNATPTAAQTMEFFQGLDNRDLRKRIDLIEDPCPYEAEFWASLSAESSIELAIDRDFDPSAQPTGAAIGVLKPARDDARLASIGKLPVLVTSYMDHPLGQMWAAFIASGLAKSNPANFRGAGLLTHQHFTGDPALDLVHSDGPRLLSPGGTGLGFDEYLNSLPWEELRG